MKTQHATGFGRSSVHSFKTFANEAPVRKLCIGLLCAASTLAPFAAHAAVTAKDIQVAGRVLGFTATPLTGNVHLGIVYDPSNAASTADEQALMGILGSGLTVGGVNLIGVPVTIANVATTPADVLFLTAGLGAAGAAAGTEAAAKKQICITTDLAATQAGDCAVSVASTPKVQITVNKAAASASGVSFGAAFMLMITQI
jgi:hypothetical protein